MQGYEVTVLTGVTLYYGSSANCRLAGRKLLYDFVNGQLILSILLEYGIMNRLHDVRNNSSLRV